MLGEIWVVSRLYIWGVLWLSASACTGCYSAMSPLGCHPHHGCPGNGGCALREHDLGEALDRFCTGKCFSAKQCVSDCGCGVGNCGCEVEELCEPQVSDNCQGMCVTQCEACGPGGCLGEHCPLRSCNLRLACKVEPGPPPVTCQPPMPPTFLPVPTRPVFSAVPPYGSGASIPSVESHWGPQLSSPGRN